jgi:DNA polymerase III delta prime subunit
MEHLIIDTLERAGAQHIRFNALTANVCSRELQRVAKAEGMALGEDDASRLVEASRCDLASAISALQLQAMGRSPSKATGNTSKKRKKTDAVGNATAWHERDLGLSLFHALGKILHNKRFDENGDRVLPGSRYCPWHHTLRRLYTASLGVPA